jgi:hypothetical protein
VNPSDLMLNAVCGFVALVLVWLITYGVVAFVGWLLYGRPAPSGPRQADHGPSHPPTKPRDEQPQDPAAEPRPGRHRGAPANEVPPRPATPPPVPLPVHDAGTVTLPRLPKETAA